MIKLQGQQTTAGAGVFQNDGAGIKVEGTLHTAGDGYWSNAQRAVKITALGIGYVNEDQSYGELQVFFDLKTWNTMEHGLIYTDKLFAKELKKFLNAQGLDGSDVSYSEQGMQGDNYVSLDVGKRFLDSWVKVVYSGNRDQFIEDNE